MTRPACPLKAARRIARDHGLLLIEKPIDPGKCTFFVYRLLDNGLKTFLGKRGTPEGIRAYVARLAKIH